MSREIARRLSKLEARKAPREGLVMVPLAAWPSEDDEAGWDRLRAKYPGARLFLPESQMGAEEWEAAGGDE